MTLAAALAPALRATRVPPIVALSGITAPSARAKRWTPWAAGVLTALGVALLVGGLFAGGPATARLGAMGAGVWVLFIGLALSARFFVRPVASVIGWPVERMFAVPGRLARENAMRSPGRTASTAAALMVGLGLVVFVAVFAAGLKASVNPSINELVRADYIISAAGRSRSLGRRRLHLGAPGVGTVARRRFDRIEVDGQQVNLTRTRSRASTRPASPASTASTGSGAADDAARQPRAGDRARRGAVRQDPRQGRRRPHHGPVAVRPRGDAAVIGLYRDPQILQGASSTSASSRRSAGARDPFLFMVSRRPGATAAGRIARSSGR